MNDSFESISRLRERYGSRLSILAHHYEHDDIVRHADHTGDSLELARKIDGLDCEHIVFCGVHFMAESAAILAREGQKVHIPDASASCTMAETAPFMLVENVLDALNRNGRKVVPLAYVNSSAAVKGICGRYGGSVCTSANARTMLSWALEKGDGVLFLPDKNLGMNTAQQLGIPSEDTMIIDVRGGGEAARGAEDKRLYLWPGVCAVHYRFRLSQVDKARREYPGCKVVVHPESSPEVVRASDAAGSTSLIIKYCDQAETGAVIVVGTEINLVKRLGERYKGEKTVLPLAESACSNMARITEDKLAAQLNNLENEPGVTVDAGVVEPARIALARMLEACA